MSWRKLWICIDKLTRIILLCLAVIVFVILAQVAFRQEHYNNYSLELQVLKEEMVELNSRSLSHMEQRLNRLQDSQDSYKLTSSNEADLLENRVERLEEIVESTDRK